MVRFRLDVGCIDAGSGAYGTGTECERRQPAAPRFRFVQVPPNKPRRRRRLVNGPDSVVADVGSVVISVDAELGWGFHDLASPPIRRVEGARVGWQRLASLFEIYRVPATWAVVGHLALASCDGVHEGHPLSPDWFARERGAWADRASLRFAPDLIRELASSEVAHEIGCHSFSHVDHTDVPRSVVRAELEASADAFRSHGIEPTSFVFPGNDVAHQDLLLPYGYTAYRGAGDSLGATRRRARKLMGAIGRRPPLVEPAIDANGLVVIPPSLFLFGFEGIARNVIEPFLRDRIVEQAIRGIDRAAERDGVLHLWLHPNDLVTQYAADRIEAILKHLRERLDNSSLEVETMREVATRTLDHPGRRREPAVDRP